MYENQVSVLALDDGLYHALEQAIREGVKQADKQPQRRKPSKRGGGIPPEQLDHMLAMAEMSYFNQEWNEAVRTYQGLLESGADLPPFVDARLALSFACLNDWEASFEHACKSYETHPTEAAAYIAMAKNTIIFTSLPQAGLRWLELASQALNIPKNVMRDIRTELEETAVINEQEEIYSLPFLQQPDLLERITTNSEFTSLVDLDELVQALESVNSGQVSLKEARGRSSSLSALLKILWNDPDVLLPREYSAEDVAKMVQKSCPLHHLGNELVRHIIAYLPLPSVGALQSTCKLAQYWANQPDTWQELYCRIWEPLSPVTYGAPLRPYMWKYNFKSRQGILAASQAVFEKILTHRADPSDIEAMRKRVLTSLSRTYRTASAVSTASTMANQFIETVDLLAGSSSPHNALQLFESPAFLTVAVTSLARIGFASSNVECQAALLALISFGLAGGPHVMQSLLVLGVKTLCSNLMFGPVHAEACALYAVMRFAETSFARAIPPVMPSSFWCANFTEERLQAVTADLNGVWRHFMFYDNMDLKNVIEMGATNMFFDFETNFISGVGSDTIGAYTLLEDSNFDLRTGEVSILRQYPNNLTLEFTGICFPFGMGGYFQHYMSPEDQEAAGEPPVLLGFWLSHQMYKVMTEEEWKVFTADMKSRAAKRAMGKIPEPWAEEPGIVASMSLELRALTRSTFLISLPSATCAEVLEEQDKMPEMSPEDLKNFVRPPLLQGSGETPEKFKLREDVHCKMMIMLFERRTTFALQKLEEVTNDLQALETGDVSSPAILHKWHDYLCLYTFDNYALSSGAEGLCQFFRMIKSMAVEIRSRGGDPSLLSAQPGTTTASSSSLDTDPLDKLPDRFEVDSDVASIDADAAAAAAHEETATPLSNKALGDHDDGEDDDDDDDDLEGDYSEDEESEEWDSAQGMTTKQKREKRQGANSMGTTLLVAGAAIAAVTAGVFAVTRYFTRKSRD